MSIAVLSQSRTATDDKANKAANDRIASFTRAFGEEHVKLACHAAFPLVLTPDILYRIWANFADDVPWIAVADILLSRLCTEVGPELFEMDLRIRTILLSQLEADERFGGKSRLDELATFLIDYVLSELHSSDPDVRSLAQSQRWIALAYTRPSEAARELLRELNDLLERYTKSPSLENRAGLMRVAYLRETFAQPLAEFVPLLSFAENVQNSLAKEKSYKPDLDSEAHAHENIVSVAQQGDGLSTLASDDMHTQAPSGVDKSPDPIRAARIQTKGIISDEEVAALHLALSELDPLPTRTPDIAVEIDPGTLELTALNTLLKRLPAEFGPHERELVLRAYLLASYAHRDQVRESGGPYVMHPIAVTTILADLQMDADTLAAGLLHDVVEDTEFDLAYLKEHFGSGIVSLVDGVTKLKRINEMSNTQQDIADAKTESLRKMFLAMVDDIRVVIIKLADRLHNMRTLEGQKKQKQERIAKETLDIFAPLASRLGIWQIKWELEDLSFRYLEPNTYRELARAIGMKRDEREKWVARVKHELETKLAEAGIKADVSGRPKHIYSIYRKMKRKDVDFDQIYDIHGFRVVVEDVGKCYAALGVVHANYRPIPGEFDDYIANPKVDMYRSLHTAVLSKDSGRPMEIQIRTREMHDAAERGIATYLQYEEPREHDARFQGKIAWLRQLMEWRQDVADDAEFVADMKTDVFHDRVYVFTPQGDVIDLPAGATPIDFAYAIHTELGHRCRGANIRGRLVPLDYKLQNGDQVTIISAKQGGPSRDWLNPDLDYVATQRARSKIRNWLRKQGRDENITRGRQMLEKEMKRLAITDSFEAVAKLFNFDKVDDFLAAIGYGDINSQHLAARVLEAERREQECRVLDERPGEASLSPSRKVDTAGGYAVQGVDGLLTRLAPCCNPAPGDPIVGYVTRGKGLTVHRSDCHNIANIVRKGQDVRLVDVQWTAVPEATYPVTVQVRAYDRAGLMRDLAALVLAVENINIVSMEALTGQKDNLAVISTTLEIENAAQLTRVLTKIGRLPNVVEAYRIREQLP